MKTSSNSPKKAPQSRGLSAMLRRLAVRRGAQAATMGALLALGAHSASAQTIFAYSGQSGSTTTPATGTFTLGFGGDGITPGDASYVTPTPGATTSLTFAGPAASNYVATDDIAGAFQLNNLTFSNLSTTTVAAATGNSLAFVTGSTITNTVTGATAAATITAPFTTTATGSAAAPDLSFNGAGTVNITEAAAGTQAAASNIGFSGGGTTAITNANNPFGNATLDFNNGNLSAGTVATFGTSTAVPDTLNFAAATTNTITEGATTNYNSLFTGSGNVNFFSTIAGETTTFAAANAFTNFTGTVKITDAQNTTLRFNGATGSAAVNFNLGTGSGVLQTRGGGTITLGALIGVSTNQLRGAGSSNTLSTYVIGGLNLPSDTFAGFITNGSSTGAAAVTAITKSGTGTLTLTGPNTYTGPTSITGGILSINSIANGGVANTVISTAGSPTVTVGNLATVAVGESISGGMFPISDPITAVNTGPPTTVTLTTGTNVGASTTLPTAATFGFANPLGISTNAAANLIFNGGTLQYTGPAASTDRLFQVGITNTSGGATIDSSGTGALQFTNTGAITFGTSANQLSTLTLTGTDADPNTVNVLIGNKSATGTTSVTKTGTGTWNLAPLAGNTYAGGTTVTQGTLNSAVTGGFGTGNITVNPTVSTGATTDNATLNSTGSIGSAAIVTINSEAEAAGGTGFGVGTVNFNGATPAIAALAGSGNAVLNSGTTTALTLGATGTATTTFTGVISQGTGTTGSLTKTGTNTQALSGANTYSGATTISNGKLLISNTTGSATGSGSVVVNPTTGVAGTPVTAILSGTGIATGPVAVTSGTPGTPDPNNTAYLAPGVNTAGSTHGGVGTLSVGTTGGLSLTAATLDYDLSAAGDQTPNTANTAANDTIVTGGTLTIGNSGAFNVNINELTADALDTTNAYTLVSGFTNQTGFNAANITTTFTGNTTSVYTPIYNLVPNGATENLAVSFAPAPEPAQTATMGLIALGMGALFLRARKRRAGDKSAS